MANILCMAPGSILVEKEHVRMDIPGARIRRRREPTRYMQSVVRAVIVCLRPIETSMAGTAWVK